LIQTLQKCTPLYCHKLTEWNKIQEFIWAHTWLRLSLLAGLCRPGAGLLSLDFGVGIPPVARSLGILVARFGVAPISTSFPGLFKLNDFILNNTYDMEGHLNIILL